MIKKTLALIAGILLLASVCQAQTWVNVNQLTCTWDIVTTDGDGDPLPADGVLHYKLYLANADTDPTKTSPVQVADVTTLEATITLNTKGRYYVGVKAVWIYTDLSEMESGINWADEIENQETVDLWAIRHHVSPKPAKNLTRQLNFGFLAEQTIRGFVNEGAMKIIGYNWITGKMVPRPWGIEYRYTVAKPDGDHINDVVMLPDGEKTDEKIIISIITEKLKQIDVEPEIMVSQEEAKEAEIKTLLVSKGLLEEWQDYRDIKSKAEILAAARGTVVWQQ